MRKDKTPQIFLNKFFIPQAIYAGWQLFSYGNKMINEEKIYAAGTVSQENIRHWLPTVLGIFHTAKYRNNKSNNNKDNNNKINTGNNKQKQNTSK